MHLLPSPHLVFERVASRATRDMVQKRQKQLKIAIKQASDCVRANRVIMDAETVSGMIEPDYVDRSWRNAQVKQRRRKLFLFEDQVKQRRRLQEVMGAKEQGPEGTM